MANDSLENVLNISDLIKRLEQIKEQHGDLPVRMRDDCGSVKFVTNDDYNFFIDKASVFDISSGVFELIDEVDALLIN